MPNQLLNERPGKITPKVLSEQTRFSYDVFPVIASMLIVAILLIGFLVWQQADRQLATYWTVAACTVSVLRVALYFAYKRFNHPNKPVIWRRAFLLGAYLSAALIALATILFYSKLDQSSKMVFMLLTIGVVSGALPVLATDLKSYAMYVGLCLMPLAVMNLADHVVANKLVGAVMLVFIGMLMLAAHLFNRALLDSMIYRYRSELLADRLQVANNRLSEANRELQQISTIDELTGVYNRRYFNQRFSEVWHDHYRQGQTLSALMIDVDHFKAYNDHFGHLQGDNCLRRIADEISSVIRRPRDFISRFGGEEFIMLLPNTDVGGAKEIAARIHVCIEQLSMPHKRSDGINRVTVSIGGVSLKPQGPDDGDSFLQQVDRALYRAKHTGRNTSVFF